MSAEPVAKSTNPPQIIAVDSVPQPMHIASLIVHVRADNLAAVKAWLGSQQDTEIHGESAQGKLVVVVEAQHERRILGLLDSLQAHAGVLNAALIYHEILSEE